MNLQEKVKEKLLASLNEDVYKVEHEGHPDADKVKELSHLKPGKKYTNHITKYPESAKKAAAMLKKNGFQGVKIYKNWQVMEGVVLEEENHTHEVHFYRESDPQQNTAKMRVTAKSDMDARTKVHQAQGEYGSVKIRKVVKLGEEASLDEAIKPKVIPTHLSSGKPNPNHPKFSEHKAAYDAAKKPTVRRRPAPKQIETHDRKLHKALENHLGGTFEHFERDPRHFVTKDGYAAAHLHVTHSYKGEDFGYAENDMPDGAAESYHVTAVRKNGKYEVHHRTLGESVDLEEGKMSEIHADIGQHMDKHIGEYKRAGGAERLMHHAAKATPKIAKLHGIEHKHAEKFVSDYIDSRLSEEKLDEAVSPKHDAAIAELSKLGYTVKHERTEPSGLRKTWMGRPTRHDERTDAVIGKYQTTRTQFTKQTDHDVYIGSYDRKKRSVSEDVLDEESKVKVGDFVHVGLAQKGGTGFEGVATHIDYANNQIHFRSKEKGKYGYRTFRGQLSNTTVK